VPDYSDGAWVRRQYRIDYQEYWYKGGGTKLRMPSWSAAWPLH
jgi:hypothetical protein